MSSSRREKYEEWFGKVFGRYGRFVARDKKTPWIILFVCAFMNIGLTIGIIKMESVTDIEEVYTPQNSEASKDRAAVKNMFPNMNGQNFNQHALSDFGLYGEVIIRTANDMNILNTTLLSQIQEIDEIIRTQIIVYDDTGRQMNFTDICAISSTGCVVDGSVILDSLFIQSVDNISYPVFSNRQISGVVGNTVVSEGILTSASLVKLRYNLRDDAEEIVSVSKRWEKEFENQISSINKTGLMISYAHSNSMNTELASSTTGDIKYFSYTLFLMTTYASLTSNAMNGNHFADRSNLCQGGVLATVLAIGSALGFTSLIGIQFVAIVCVMPFLVIGIGLDDIFVLMSAMADATKLATQETRKSKSEHNVTEKRQRKLFIALKGSAVAITITSLTNFLAFGIGSTSTFLSVKNFCLTTGIAVLFCYFNQLFFFVPCIVINEQRVESGRHNVTCLKMKSKHDTENRSKASIICCSGDIPKDRDDFDGALEKLRKLLIKAIVREIPCKIIILIVFIAYLGASIWGIVNFKLGLDLNKLASTDSYYYNYSTWNDLYFRVEIPVSFVIRSEVMYSSHRTQDQITSLLQTAKNMDAIDSSFEINWLSEYKNTPFYHDHNETAFVGGLKEFLNKGGSRFKTDIVFDETESRITASRFYVISSNVKDSTDQGKMMLDLKAVASSSEPPCFAYAPPFIFFEQYVQVLRSTLQTVGIALAVMIIITTIFMPQPVLIFFVFLTMVMILVGVFGFMYYWDLTLNSVTMVHLVMVVGFSVDFSVHICHAFASVTVTEEDVVKPHFCSGEGRNVRDIRVEKAIDRSGGPILNAALSSIVGILMLILSTSYIFQSFFKLMLLVILFGLAHSVLLLPVLLSFAGPKPNEGRGLYNNRTSGRGVSLEPDYDNRNNTNEAFQVDVSIGHFRNSLSGNVNNYAKTSQPQINITEQFGQSTRL